LTKWVQMGAPWPKEKGATVAHVADNTASERYEHLRKEHWAWQPLHDSPAPVVKDGSWARSDLDHFVLAKLEAKGIKPVANADKLTLIRRLTFDLTGLP